jgi:eukaryotic-like serine/threonine-protein kinase
MKRLALLFLFVIIQVSACFPQATGGKPAGQAPGPSLAWKYPLTAPVFSSPVIFKGTVYFGCLDSSFYAIDLLTGKKLWSFKTGGSIRSTALLNANKLYFTSGDGKLYCLDLAGKLAWSFSGHSDKKYDFADYFQSSPIIAGDAIFFGSGDGYFYAVNLAGGTLKWEFQTGDVIHSTPAINGNKIFFGSFDGFVYALSVNDGSLAWKFKTVGNSYFPKGEVQGSPVIAGRLVIVGARDYNVYALDAEKGYCHWNKVFTNGWVLANTVHDSVLYLAGADERILAAVDPATGNIKWKQDMEFLLFGPAVFDSARLYIGTTIGKVHGIDIHNGKKLWTFKTDGYRANHLKYFKPDDSYRNDIYSIITSNEQFLDVEMELGGVFSSPALSNGYLVFTSTEGAVYCLKLPVE